MGYAHHTIGFTRYETLVNTLKILGISYSESLLEPIRFLDETSEGLRFRIVTFTGNDRRKWVAEEYLEVDDQDCDGISVVGLAIYPAGERPEELPTKEATWPPQPAV